MQDLSKYFVYDIDKSVERALTPYPLEKLTLERRYLFQSLKLYINRFR
jgi:hypothetical protein